IEGHSDNQPIVGALTQRYPTNWELSAARAINIARYLQKQGVDPANLSSAAFGEFKPVADNVTPEGRAKNRRIEIVLLPKERPTRRRRTRAGGVFISPFSVHPFLTAGGRPDILAAHALRRGSDQSLRSHAL